MVKQNPVDSLKESIRLLEIRQTEEGKILKEQFKITYESLKPINLIKNSVKELASSVEIKNSLFETIVSIMTGYLTKKLMISSKSSTLMKLVGVFLQFGVTSLISNNAETIRIFMSDLIDRFLHPAPEEVPETEM
jgi:hypothetical protein